MPAVVKKKEFTFDELLAINCSPVIAAGPKKKTKVPSLFPAAIQQMIDSVIVIANHVSRLIGAGSAVVTGLLGLVAAIAEFIALCPAYLMKALLSLLPSLTFPGFSAFIPKFDISFDDFDDLDICNVEITWPTILAVILRAAFLIITRFIWSLVTWLFEQIFKFIVGIFQIIADIKAWWACTKQKFKAIMSMVIDAIKNEGKEKGLKSPRAQVLKALKPYIGKIMKQYKIVDDNIDLLLDLLDLTPYVIEVELDNIKKALYSTSNGLNCIRQVQRIAEAGGF